jgi:hypothetical protein
MMNGTSGAAVRLSYLKIRDVTTKDEESNGAATYVVVLPAPEILKIGTDGNLRSYIPEHDPAPIPRGQCARLRAHPSPRPSPCLS